MSLRSGFEPKLAPGRILAVCTPPQGGAGHSCGHLKRDYNRAVNRSSHAHGYVRCSHCHHRVFNVQARECPHCGHRLHWVSKPLLVWIFGGIIAAVLSILLAIWLAESDGMRSESPQESFSSQ